MAYNPKVVSIWLALLITGVVCVLLSAGLFALLWWVG